MASRAARRKAWASNCSVRPEKESLTPPRVTLEEHTALQREYQDLYHDLLALKASLESRLSDQKETDWRAYQGHGSGGPEPMDPVHPGSLHSHFRDIAELRKQLDKQREATEAEKAKREAAEKREQGSAKHQGTLAREKNELEKELIALKSNIETIGKERDDLKTKLHEVGQFDTRRNRCRGH